jgi:primosomal protein N' (replication factor Y)
MRAESGDPEAAMGFLARALNAAAGMVDGDLELFGPVPAPMERRAGRHRAHLLVQSQSRLTLQRFLARWLAAVRVLKGTKGVRWSLDVDPQDLL